ncbi:MAG: alpha/beta hydrolase [Pirellulales bacterium]
MTRRDVLMCGAAMGGGLLFYHSSSAQSAETLPETHTYKTVGNLAVKADVYRYHDALTRPAVVWIHGGALIGGHRADISGRVKKHALDAGYVLISIDYRLAPETPLPEIIQDLEDAFAWIHHDGPKRFKIDPTRIAVIGGSAGGYLTLTSGFRVRPRPTVLLSLWGYGDLIGDWYSTPSPHPRHHQTRPTREEALRQVSGPAISDSRDRTGDGGLFYQYCRQTGTWPTAVSGWDPINEAERFYPFMPVQNVTAEYPPTVLIHGTSDTDVPYEQSILMVEQFKQHNVPHQLVSIAGGEHGLSGGDPSLIDAAYTKAFAFVDEHLQK